VSGEKPVLASDDRTLPAAHQGKIAPNYYCRAWNAKRGKYCGARAGHGTAHPGRGRCNMHGGQKRGGDARVKAARYSTINNERLSELIADHMEDADPLNMLPDVAAARAIFQDFIERYGPITDALIAWHDTWDGRFTPIGEPEKAALLGALEELEALLGDRESATEEQLAQLDLARAAVAFLSAPRAEKPRRILDISDAVGHLDVISKMVARIEQARATNAISRPELLRVMTEMGRVVQGFVTDQEILNRIRDGWLGIRL
jgi:hypothetical protein